MNSTDSLTVNGFGFGALASSSIVFAVMDPTLAAAAAVTVLSSIGGTVVLIINASSAAKDRREAAKERIQQLLLSQQAAVVSVEMNRKADALVTSTAEIKELTNSTNSNLQKAVELLTAKNAALEERIAQAEKTKKETETAQAITDIRVTTALGTPVPTSKGDVKDAIAESPHLKEIEKNTSDTAVNTKKGE